MFAVMGLVVAGLLAPQVATRAFAAQPDPASWELPEGAYRDPYMIIQAGVTDLDDTTNKSFKVGITYRSVASPLKDWVYLRIDPRIAPYIESVNTNSGCTIFGKFSGHCNNFTKVEASTMDGKRPDPYAGQTGVWRAKADGPGGLFTALPLQNQQHDVQVQVTVNRPISEIVEGVGDDEWVVDVRWQSQKNDGSVKIDPRTLSNGAVVYVGDTRKQPRQRTGAAFNWVTAPVFTKLYYSYEGNVIDPKGYSQPGPEGATVLRAQVIQPHGIASYNTAVGAWQPYEFHLHLQPEVIDALVAPVVVWQKMTAGTPGNAADTPVLVPRDKFTPEGNVTVTTDKTKADVNGYVYTSDVTHFLNRFASSPFNSSTLVDVPINEDQIIVDRDDPDYFKQINMASWFTDKNRGEDRFLEYTLGTVYWNMKVSTAPEVTNISRGNDDASTDQLTDETNVVRDSQNFLRGTAEPDSDVDVFKVADGKRELIARTTANNKGEWATKLCRPQAIMDDKGDITGYTECTAKTLAEWGITSDSDAKIVVTARQYLMAASKDVNLTVRSIPSADPKVNATDDQPVLSTATQITGILGAQHQNTTSTEVSAFIRTGTPENYSFEKIGTSTPVKGNINGGQAFTIPVEAGKLSTCPTVVLRATEGSYPKNYAGKLHVDLYNEKNEVSTPGTSEAADDGYGPSADVLVPVCAKVSVTFDVKDAQRNGVPTTVKVTENQSLGENFPTQIPVKPGSVFQGWATSENAKQADFTAETPIRQSLTVYPVWTADPAAAVPVTDGDNASAAIIDEGPKKADGSDTHTVTVTLKNKFGQPILGAGTKLKLTTETEGFTGPVIRFDPFKELGEGVYTATVAATKVGDPTLVATWRDSQNAVTIPGNLTAHFVAGDPDLDGARSNYVVSEGEQPARDGAHSVTVVLSDALGNAVTGKADQLRASATGLVGATVGRFTESDTPGTYTATVTSEQKKAGVATVAVRYGDQPMVSRDDKNRATFKAGAFDPEASAVSVKKGEQETSKIVAGDTVTITATPTDAYGNPVDLGPSMTVTVPGSDEQITLQRQDNGSYKADTTPTKAAEGPLTFPGHEGLDGKKSVKITAAQPNNAMFAEDAPAQATSGTPVEGVTATVTDAHGNPVKGQTVYVELPGSESRTPVVVGEDGAVTIPAWTPTTVGNETIRIYAGAENGQPIGEHRVTVLAGAPNAEKSQLDINPTTPKAGDSVRVTYTPIDTNGNPAPLPDGKKVTITVPGINEPVELTKDGDTYTGTFTPEKAGPTNVKVSVDGQDGPTTTVTVIPNDPAKAIFTDTPGAAVAGEPVQGGTITVKDAYDNPVAEGTIVKVTVPGEDSPREVTVGPNGQAQIGEIMLTTAGANDIVVSAGNPAKQIGSTTVTVSAGDIDPDHSAVTVTKNGEPVGEITAGETVNITVDPKDATDNPVDLGEKIVVKVPGVDGDVELSKQPNGSYTGEATPTTAGNGSVKIPAKPELDGKATLNVKPGAASATESTLVVNPNEVTSGTEVTVTYTPKDEHGNATALPEGQKVTVTVPGIAEPVELIKGEDGSYTATFVPTQAGTSTVTTTVGDNPGPQASLTITPGTPARATVTDAPSNAVAGAPVSAGTVTVTDEHGNAVPAGTTVYVKVPGSDSWTPVEIAAEGKAPIGTFTPVLAGDARIEVASDPEGSNIIGTHDVTVTAGAVDPNATSVTVTKNGETVENVKAGDTVTIVVDPKDANGNTVDLGDKIAVTVPGIDGDVELTKQPDGTYKAEVRPTKPGSGTITFPSKPELDGKANLTVKAGAPNANQSTLVVEPTSPNKGVETTLTYTPVDEFGNPTTLADGEKVTVTVPGIADPIELTKDENASYTGTFTPVVEGTNELTSQVGDQSGPSATITVLPPIPGAPAQGVGNDLPTEATSGVTVAQPGTVTIADDEGVPISAGAKVYVKVPGAEIPIEVTVGEGGVVTIPEFTPVTPGVDRIEISTSADGLKPFFSHELNVKPGAPDAGHSVLVVNPAEPVQGSDSTITYTPKDVNGNKTTLPEGESVTVAVPDGKGGTTTVTLTKQPDGTYTGTFVPMQDGEQQITSTVGTEAGPELTITVAPKPVAGPTDVVANGKQASGKVDPSVPTGATVTVRNDKGEVIGTGKVEESKGEKTFVVTYDEEKKPSDGDQIRVTVTDPQTGHESPAVSVRVDADAPELTVDPTNGNKITGTTEPGSKVTISYTGTDGQKHTVAVDVNDDGSFMLDLDPKAKKGSDVRIVAEDPAGNQTTVTVSVEAERPTQPTVDITPAKPTTVTGTTDEGTTITVCVTHRGDSDPHCVEATVTDGKYSADVPALKDGDTVVVTAESSQGAKNDTTKVVDFSNTLTNIKLSEDGRTITGTTDPGASVTVTLPGGQKLTETAGSDGTFAVTLPRPLVPGGTATVVSTDSTGNEARGQITAPAAVPDPDPQPGETADPTEEPSQPADGTQQPSAEPSQSVKGEQTLPRGGSAPTQPQVDESGALAVTGAQAGLLAVLATVLLTGGSS